MNGFTDARRRGPQRRFGTTKPNGPPCPDGTYNNTTNVLSSAHSPDLVVLLRMACYGDHTRAQTTLFTK